ncbi:hypothetical protein [Paenibacillus sp. XY044]|nr:hypothetical protein [Paenibacillus sp. XY044]
MSNPWACGTAGGDQHIYDADDPSDQFHRRGFLAEGTVLMVSNKPY